MRGGGSGDGERRAKGRLVVQIRMYHNIRAGNSSCAIAHNHYDMYSIPLGPEGNEI